MEMEDIIAILLGTFGPFMIVISVTLFAKTSIQKILKPFLEAFKTEEAFPDGGIRAWSFKNGKMHQKSSVRIVERDRNLYAKIPLIPTLKVPFSALKAVHTRKTPFKTLIVKLIFTNPAMAPIEFSLNAAQVAQFPELMKLSKDQPEPRKKAMPSLQPRQQGMTEQAGNLIRASILIMGIGVALALFLYYGPY